MLVLAGSARWSGDRGARPSSSSLTAGVLELVLRRLFPGEGQFPFSVADFIPGVAFAVLGILVTARVPRARRLLGLFAVFLAAILIAFVVPSDLGSNVERLKFAAIPIALLAAGAREAETHRARGRPRRGRRLLEHLRARPHGEERNRRPRAYDGVLGTCDRLPAPHLSPSYRVEAVDTAEHWPAAYLPDAGIPIVRGWYRQNDFPQNELLYDKTLAAPATYEAWLRARACATSCCPTRGRTTARSTRRR